MGTNKREIQIGIVLVLVIFAFILIPGCTERTDTDVTSSQETCTGKNWTMAVADADFSPRGGYSSVVFKDRMWVIGGYNDETGPRDDVWYSTNGKDWIQANSSLGFFKERSCQSAVVFKDKIWIIGGGWGDEIGGDVWYSDDGIIWTQATPMAEFGPRVHHSTVVFNNRLWVIGGERGFTQSQWLRDAWYSDDGMSWTQATPQVAFTPIWRQNLLVLDNKIWNIGNVFYRPEKGSTIEYNEIWNSVNGRDWKRVASHGSFPARTAPCSVLYNNKMWIIGGNNQTSDYLGDVWHSSDGIEWEQATTAAEFSWNTTRYSHPQALVFNNRIWIIREYGEGFIDKNDVWFSYDQPAESVNTQTTR
jgi:hypothetical protein